MAGNLEELKKVRKSVGINMQLSMSYLIPILEDFGKRIKALEQAEEEINDVKVGGTDPD